MINEKDVPEILEKELPDIKIELERHMENILKIMQSFANFTKRCAESGSIDKLKSYFTIAVRLLRKGNHVVKLVLEKVYIYSVSALIEIVSPISTMVKKLLPATLKKDCMKYMAEVISYNDNKDENCLFPNEIIASQNKYYIPFNG